LNAADRWNTPKQNAEKYGRVCRWWQEHGGITSAGYDLFGEYKGLNRPNFACLSCMLRPRCVYEHRDKNGNLHGRGGMSFKRLEKWQHILDHPEMTPYQLAALLHVIPRTVWQVRYLYKEYFEDQMLPAKIPEFKTREEEAEFWHKYSPLDFPNETKEVKMKVRKNLKITRV